MERPDWDQDGLKWPNRKSSHFVRAAGLRWHVQRMGAGPALLMLHGTGAATHSWRSLAPLLAQRFSIIAPDLPGHGFTELPPQDRLSLPGMGAAVKGLMQEIGVVPIAAVGHSAGAAILARMCLDHLIEPRLLISLNGALLAPRGLQWQLFSPAARLLAGHPLPSRLFAWRAGDQAVIERLVRDTGSRIDPEGIELYRRLARRPSHVAAALGMMANWDLWPLERDLPRLTPALRQIVGANDRTIPPVAALRIRSLVPGATVTSLPGLGHLAHEEQPEEVARLVIEAARETGVIDGD